MKFILIYMMFLNNGVTITSIEFDSKSACQKASMLIGNMIENNKGLFMKAESRCTEKKL